MIKTKFFPFDGGENLVDPVIVMKPGELHESMNYETGANGGYVRVDGIERYDGQQSPSSLDKASYPTLDDWKIAVEIQRALIQPIPGSGPVRGVWSFDNEIYGFRDDAGATACAMYQSTASGWSLVSSAFPAGGSYEFINYNFYGASDLKEMYGVNGVGQAFKFDGTTVTLISTGMVVDTPNHIFAHKNHLFLSFPGGSVQHSSPGEPTVWTAILGAAEIAIGDDVTGFSAVPGNTLAIFGRNKIALLYGTSVADWDLTTYSIDAGALPWSMQSMEVPYFLDDRGIKKLTTTSSYGDFNMNTVSEKIKPKLDLLTTSLTTSMRVRSKDQYRLFFSEGTIMTCTFSNGEIRGITHSQYGEEVDGVFVPKVFVKAISAEDSDGAEILLAGDTDGYVYLLDHGNSADGQPIEAYIRPVFYHFGSPENLKRFTKIVLEIETPNQIDMTFLPEYSYGDPLLPVAIESEATVSAGAGTWGESYWEAFYWDSQSLSTAYGYISGYGKNFRMIIRSVGTYEAAHTIQGATIHYSVKGLSR